jgi:hypothetical protein
MQVGPQRAREMSLAAGERRLVHAPAKSILVSLRGAEVMVEQQVCLGDASFTIRTPLRQGETCSVAYGGHFVLHASRPACVRVVPASPFMAAAAQHAAAVAGALARALSACGRRLRRRAEA